jgi:hypothetical protein
MHPGSCVLWERSASPNNLYRSHICVKMVAFQFYLQSGKQKIRVGVGRQSSCFGQKFPDEKWKCETVRCRDATAFSFIVKVQGGVFAHFHAVSANRHSSTWSWLFSLPGRVLCEQSFDVKEYDEHAPDFALHLSRLLRSRWVWTLRVRLMLSSSNACVIIARVSVTHFPRVAQNLMHIRCRIPCEIPSGQIRDSK